MKANRSDVADGKRVGIWIRVSTEDQALGDSPEHHERRARYYAEAKSWTVVEVYHLESVSGKAVIGHPEAKRMLDDVRRGHVTGLIFSKLARLARNTKELLDFADIFRDCDADLISLQESIDTSTPAGRLFYTMIAAMAQWEREEIAERVAASVPVRARLGKPLGGAAPFGYEWKDRELVHHPDEAPVRKRMYALFIEHRRKKTVARLLNEAGHRTRNGSLFSDTTVDRLLRDPIAKGQRRTNYTRSLGEKRHWKLKDESEWIMHEVEPLISEEEWQRCVAILDEQKQHPRFSAKKPVQLFAGVAYCACGERMYVPSNTPKYVCFNCRNKLPATDLEAIFQEQLRGFFFSADDLVRYVEQADRSLAEKRELLTALETKKRKLKADMDKMMRLYLDGSISSEGFGHEYRPLEEQLSQLDEQVPELQADLDFMTIQCLSRDEIVEEAKDLYTHWHDLEASDKRQVIENTVERIVIGQEDVTIQLSYVPSPPVNMAKGQRNLTDS
ncbi:MAG TPA: recombinase family protein [Pyrinomonadaceae bacterium]